MGKAERMANLMRRELADTRQGELHGIIGLAAIGFTRAKQAFENHAILAHAQTAEVHMAFEHFARARVRHTAAIGPAACLAVDPLHGVIANIERVGIFGQKLDAICAFPACRFKSIFPPARAFDKGRANRLRRAAVDIKDNGFDDIAVLAPGQAVAPRKTGFNVIRQRRRIIIMHTLYRARARVRDTRRIAVFWQADKTMMLDEGRIASIGRRARNFRTGIGGAEREEHIYFDIIGKGKSLRGIYKCSVRLNFETPLICIF